MAHPNAIVSPRARRSVGRIRAVVLVVLAGTLGAGTARAADIHHVDAAGARTLLETEAETIILDVRTPGEFGATHIDRPDTMNIDIDAVDFRERVAQLDPKATYLVHCAAGIPGGRSERAAVVLEELGFAEVHHLDGGINAWKAAGYGIEGTAARAGDR